MASISATILKHHKKQNGTWGVKYRITHKGKSVYLDTNFVAKKEDLDTKLRLKNIFIDRFLSNELNALRDKINTLGVRLDLMSAANVKAFLMKDEQEPLDFFKYSIEYLESIEGRVNTLKQREASIRRLKEFVGSDILSPFDFKVKFLEDFQKFLKTPIRSDAINRGGRSNQTIANTIRDIKVIFDSMKLKYNDYDNGVISIPNDPFKLYKPVVVKKTRNRNLDLDDLLALRDMKLVYKADIISRDILMLSFYLCGMNAVDIYKYIDESVIGLERIEYNRTKTKGKRKDEAFISIKVPPEAKVLINMYAGVIQRNYKSVKSLNNRFSESFKVIGEYLGIDRLTFYHARHTFASLARNECRFSKDDVAAALNHSSSTITDVYIAKDWSIIDDVQQGVLSLLRNYKAI